MNGLYFSTIIVFMNLTFCNATVDFRDNYGERIPDFRGLKRPYSVMNIDIQLKNHWTIHNNEIYIQIYFIFTYQYTRNDSE